MPARPQGTPTPQPALRRRSCHAGGAASVAAVPPPRSRSVSALTPMAASAPPAPARRRRPARRVRPRAASVAVLRRRRDRPGRGAAAVLGRRDRTARAAARRPSLRGRPYHYGAAGPRSFDCSGYTRYVFAHAVHRSLPHSSAAQYRLAHKIAKSAIRPGDLVFFVSGGHVYHVAIYAGHGLIWHAPHTGDHVRLARISTSSWVAGRVL